MMRSAKNSNATTRTSLIIVVRMHTFKVVKTNVEPVNKSIPGSVETVEGSLFAIVDVESREVDSDITYTLRMTDGELIHVLRHHLHRRRWYGIAFVQVTNDKKHDFYSSQAFADRRLRFFEIWQEDGLDKTLEFYLESSDGTGTVPRVTSDSMLKSQTQSAVTSKQAQQTVVLR
jgi:hypothetical protein